VLLVALAIALAPNPAAGDAAPAAVPAGQLLREAENAYAELRRIAADARVLVLTGLTDEESHRQAARLGAAGLVLKQNAAEVLLKAIRKVNEGETWLDRSVMSNLLHEMNRPKKQIDPEEAKMASLTIRERDVIALIAEGQKNKQIAERLFISETTVTHHLSSIYSKLGVSDRLELVIYAFSHSLAKMPRSRG